jgi:hypothetical protein
MFLAAKPTIFRSFSHNSSGLPKILDFPLGTSLETINDQEAALPKIDRRTSAEN